MLTLINRKVDYPLQSLFGFDIHKVDLAPLGAQDPSLTLVSALFTESEPVLVLTKNAQENKDLASKDLIGKTANDLESLLYLKNYKLQINPALVYKLEDIKEVIGANQLTTLNNKYVFIESQLQNVQDDIYEAIFELQLKNLNLVLTSPCKEEYFTAKMQRLDRLRTRNCNYQIDIFSLTGYHGPVAKKISTHLLESEQVSFIALELINADFIKQTQGIRISRKVADLLAEQLFF